MIGFHTFQSAMRMRSVFLAALTGLLLGCAHKDLPPIAPVNYAEFDQICLNVGKVDVVDATDIHPVAGDIAQTAPRPLIDGLREMVAKRLEPVGVDGTAKVTIVRASIQHAPVSTLIGRVSLRIDISSPSSNAAGYAVARAHRTFFTGDVPAESPTALGNLTTMLIKDTNLAMQAQINHVLGDWLSDASGLPLRNAVSATALTKSSGDPEGSAQAPTASSGTVDGVKTPDAPPQSQKPVTAPEQHEPVAPDAIFPLGDDDNAAASSNGTAPLKGSSPPPQFLKLPTHASH